MEQVVQVIEHSADQVADRSMNTYELVEGTSDALVLHCSDPRFQKAFHDFLHDELKLRMPAVIAIPGSSSSVGVQAFLPKNWYALRNQIELMATHNSFPRVVLINHDDCKGYAHIAQWLKGITNLAGEQRKHLNVLASYIKKEYLPSAKFELYQARIVEDSGTRRIKFESVI